jgi:phospho-N-acetylmuramoyl-pentapeptide-transferase
LDNPLSVLALDSGLWTLDSLFGFGVALVFVLACGRPCIAWLARHCREHIRQDSKHLAAILSVKAATPTMGGVLILAGFLTAIVLLADPARPEVLAAIALAGGLGLVGIWDDRTKARTRRGISARAKLAAQLLVATAVIAWLIDCDCFHPDSWSLLGGLFLIVGLSNAVNLTDGLDGLASGCSLLVLVTVGLLAIGTNGAVAQMCFSLAGAVLGFLWFNRHPARVFMGDTGSLPLGGLMGLFVLLGDSKLPLLVACGVFGVEAASVVLQVTSFRLTGRRIFRCAPLHHHFQFLNWPEKQIVRRFWLAGLVCSLLAAVSAWLLLPKAQVAAHSSPNVVQR